MRRHVVLNLGGRTAGRTGEEIARLKRRLKFGPRLTRKGRVEFARQLMNKFEEIGVEITKMSMRREKTGPTKPIGVIGETKALGRKMASYTVAANRRETFEGCR